jgi:hypothetical protein
MSRGGTGRIKRDDEIALSDLGDPFAVHGLGIVPLLGDDALHLPAMDLLEHALDGEELVGGKQNRIVNTSIIILPGKVMDIRV